MEQSSRMHRVGISLMTQINCYYRVRTLNLSYCPDKYFLYKGLVEMLNSIFYNIYPFVFTIIYDNQNKKRFKKKVCPLVNKLTQYWFCLPRKGLKWTDCQYTIKFHYPHPLIFRLASIKTTSFFQSQTAVFNVSESQFTDQPALKTNVCQYIGWSYYIVELYCSHCFHDVFWDTIIIECSFSLYKALLSFKIYRQDHNISDIKLFICF